MVGMSVYLPVRSKKMVMGIVVLSPGIKVLVPMTLRQVTVEHGRKWGGLDAEKRTNDAVLPKFPHLRFDLSVQLVHRAQGTMELGELVVAAVVKGTPDVVPFAVVLHFYLGQISDRTMRGWAHVKPDFPTV